MKPESHRRNDPDSIVYRFRDSVALQSRDLELSLLLSQILDLISFSLTLVTFNHSSPVCYNKLFTLQSLKRTRFTYQNDGLRLGLLPFAGYRRTGPRNAKPIRSLAELNPQSPPFRQNTEVLSLSLSSKP